MLTREKDLRVCGGRRSSFECVSSFADGLQPDPEKAADGPSSSLVGQVIHSLWANDDTAVIMQVVRIKQRWPGTRRPCR